MKTTDLLDSQYRDLGKVRLPEFKSRQVCMHPFEIGSAVMGDEFKDYTETVKKLCAAAGYSSGHAYLTVDEKIIQPGWSQRRPRAHVDGRMMDDKKWSQGGWIHYRDGIPFKRTAIIVAATYPGCVAYKGIFYGWPKSDGDLEHIRNQFGASDMLPADRAFLLSPDCVHESIIFDRPTKRSFLRIALPNEAQ